MIVALLLFVVNITSNLLISYAPLLVKSVEWIQLGRKYRDHSKRFHLVLTCKQTVIT